MGVNGGVLRAIQDVPRVFDILWMFQESYKCVSRKFHGSFKGVSSVSQVC